MNIFEFGKAICYSGYRQGQSPSTAVPTPEQIAEDMDILFKDGYRYLRMYDPNQHARLVLETIRAKHLPFKCLIGIDSLPEISNPNCPWDRQNIPEEVLQQNRERNDKELDKLIALVKEFDEEVIAVSVGNENTPSWGARLVPPARLLSHSKTLKASLHKPVTFCEGVFEWAHLQELGDYLDFISIHSYPYHYGDPVEDAVAINKKQYAEIQAQFPGKQIIFTEVGWSTSTTDNAQKRSSVENQKAYITELNQWITQDQVIAFLFEAFDEPWKGKNPIASECNWGLYTVDRKKKW